MKKAIFAFILASIILVSFAALMHQQKSFSFSVTHTPSCLVQIHPGITSLLMTANNPYCMLTVPTAALCADTATSSQEPFNNGTRTRIYNYIKIESGVQFRGIYAALSLPIGLAQYHLSVLVKSGLVSFIRDGKYKRFFQSKKFSRKEMLMISLLRHETVKRIFEALLNKKQLSHGELAYEVALTSQALTWQMKRIGKTAFMKQNSKGLKTIYSLDEKSEPTLIRYLTLIE